MAILKRTPSSVLWLMNFTPIGIRTLQREAKRRGIAPQRLLASDFFAVEVEFAAKANCDLFLDTRLFNGHTTVSDALWAGIPVLVFPQKVSCACSFVISVCLKLTYCLFSTGLRESPGR
jgi:predicted O-linked N-acetylglucosamine transferase (SPINDLY family)